MNFLLNIKLKKIGAVKFIEILILL